MARNQLSRRAGGFGTSLPNRIADFIQRWWWFVSGVSFPSLSAWAKSDLGLNTLSWMDALVVGVFGTLTLTCLLLGVLVLLRQLYPREVAARDRESFANEEIDIRELADGGEEIIYGRKFSRCVISGAGLYRFTSSVLILCSSREGYISSAPGQHFGGSPLMAGCTFDRCYFDGALVRPADHSPESEREVSTEGLENWKARRWTK